jgi:hypothetical protein
MSKIKITYCIPISPIIVYIEPAAPNVCPIADFIAVTVGLEPNNFLIEFASI